MRDKCLGCLWMIVIQVWPVVLPRWIHVEFHVFLCLILARISFHMSSESQDNQVHPLFSSILSTTTHSVYAVSSKYKILLITSILSNMFCMYNLNHWQMIGTFQLILFLFLMESGSKLSSWLSHMSFHQQKWDNYSAYLGAFLIYPQSSKYRLLYVNLRNRRSSSWLVCW